MKRAWAVRWRELLAFALALARSYEAGLRREGILPSLRALWRADRHLQ